MEPDLQRNHLASAQATKLSVRLGPFKILDITFMRFTTSLLSNAKKHPSKAMKICYGQLSNHTFCQKADLYDSIIRVLKT